MSRVASTPTAQPVSPPPMKVSHEKIAMRAYEKWVKRGMMHGNDKQDWMEAEMELMAEMKKGMQGHTPTTGNMRR